MLPVNLQAVIDEMDAPGEETIAYINRKTGELVTLSEEEISCAEEDGDNDSVLEWQKELVEEAKRVLADDDFIELPDRFDIHEYSIMERFCTTTEDERLQNNLFRAIAGKGAVRRFQDRVAEAGIGDDWFAFRDAAFKRIAAEFLESEGIAFADD